MLLQNVFNTLDKTGMKKPNDDPNTEDSAKPKTKEECSRALHILDSAPAPGWTAHVTKDGRLYYCKYVLFKLKLTHKLIIIK